MASIGTNGYGYSVSLYTIGTTILKENQIGLLDSMQCHIIRLMLMMNMKNDMNYDHPKQPIDGSFAPMQYTLLEMRERQRFADMQRFGHIQSINTDLEDALYPERKAKRIQEQREREQAYWREQAKELSDRELLEEIYVQLKTRWII